MNINGNFWWAASISTKLVNRLFISSSMLSLRSPVRLRVETTDTGDNVALSDISLGCANANWIDILKERDAPINIRVIMEGLSSVFAPIPVDGIF
jgi:hypothetical protein